MSAAGPEMAPGGSSDAVDVRRLLLILRRRRRMLVACCLPVFLALAWSSTLTNEYRATAVTALLPSERADATYSAHATQIYARTRVFTLVSADNLSAVRSSLGLALPLRRLRERTLTRWEPGTAVVTVEVTWPDAAGAQAVANAIAEGQGAREVVTGSLRSVLLAPAVDAAVVRSAPVVVLAAAAAAACAGLLLCVALDVVPGRVLTAGDLARVLPSGTPLVGVPRRSSGVSAMRRLRPVASHLRMGGQQFAVVTWGDAAVLAGLVAAVRESGARAATSMSLEDALAAAGKAGRAGLAGWPVVLLVEGGSATRADVDAEVAVLRDRGATLEAVVVAE